MAETMIIRMEPGRKYERGEKVGDKAHQTEVEVIKHNPKTATLIIKLPGGTHWVANYSPREYHGVVYRALKLGDPHDFPLSKPRTYANIIDAEVLAEWTPRKAKK